MTIDYADYPKGQIAVNGGNLQDAFDIQVKFDDGETDVHTLRNGGMAAGSTGGKRKCEITFKSAIGQEGFERDYMGNHSKRKVVNVRVKVPGKTISVTGRFRQPSISSNLDGFIEFTVTIGGKYSLV
jgi:hypothetical protein